MAHTPGPWEADGCIDTGSGSRYYQIDGPTPAGLSTSYPYTVGDTLNRHHCISPEEDAANARLIASAPALLAALRAVVDSIGDEPGQDHRLHAPWRIATDALSLLTEVA